MDVRSSVLPTYTTLYENIRLNKCMEFKASIYSTHNTSIQIAYSSLRDESPAKVPFLKLFALTLLK